MPAMFPLMRTMETSLHPMAIVALGLVIQVLFAVIVYGVLMLLNCIFVGRPEEDTEGLEKGKKGKTPFLAHYQDGNLVTFLKLQFETKCVSIFQIVLSSQFEKLIEM